MKTLIIVRHAKSSWDNIGQDDKERPLNDRGKKDAPEMAKRLKDRNIKVDKFVSSPAKRAKKTAKYFAEAYDTDKKDIVITDELYDASPANFYQVVAQLKDDWDAVAIFSHNPGITSFVNSLTNVQIDNMPTCGIFAVQADVESWQAFSKADKKFLFYDYPKNPLAAI